MASNVPLKHITEAYARIKPFVHQTPVLTCSTFDKIASEKAKKPIQLYFKTENLQKTGAFKARGACNAVLLAKENLKVELNGIVTHSSGNHGQAVAYACSKVEFSFFTQWATCFVLVYSCIKIICSTLEF